MSSNFFAIYSSGFSGGGGGTGTVTSVSVVTSNGFAGTVANATTTPAITIETTVTGILQGNGTAISAATTGNLTDVGTDGITVTGGTGAVLGSGTSLSQAQASGTQNGFLAATDWTTFNNKQSTITTGNLTDSATDGITITGGTGAVIGSGTSIQQAKATALANGYLSSTDWSTFNNKQSTITTGNLTDAGTDGITVTGGTGAVIGSGTSIAQAKSSASQNGYLSSADWSTFNGKGSGTVTSVSVASSNGFAGSSSGGATPSLTLSTSVTGVLQGNGTSISAATTTGSGNVVLQTSPALVTPALGTPSSGTLTNCTGYPASTASAAGLWTPGATPGYTGGVAISSGNIGEVQTVTTTSGPANGSGNAYNVATKSLPPGVWIVYGSFQFSEGTGTLTTFVLGDVNTSSATLRSGLYVGMNYAAPAGGLTPAMSTLPILVNVSTGTNVFLVGLYNYSVAGTSTMTGTIYAVRIA